MIKRILSIHSYVASGQVGNAVATFVFQRAGHQVVAVPTVIYSNHPGHPRHTGRRLPATELNDLLTGLSDNNWFGAIHAVLTGYLGSPDQADVLAGYIQDLKRQFPDLLYCCDPVCGDDEKGLYVDPPTADAIRTRLLPMADLATPNRFELDYLLGADSSADRDIAERVRRFPCPMTLCTSVRPGPGRIGEILSTPAGLFTAQTPFLDNLPKGSGDLYTAIFLSKLLRGAPSEEALAATSLAAHKILKASRGRSDLALVANQSLLR